MVLHNLGPEPVRLVGLDVTHEGTIELGNDVTRLSSPLGPGVSSKVVYQMQLPCSATAQRDLGIPELTARVRTVDNAVHPVPVNLDVVNDNGGLLQACEIATGDGPSDSDVNYSYSSAVDADGTLRITILVGDAPQTLRLVTPEVGQAVRFVTEPRLPATVQPGGPFVVRVRPEVSHCGPKRTNYDSLQGIGVSIGTQQIRDENLPVLVAEAIGRACAKAQQ